MGNVSGMGVGGYRGGMNQTMGMNMGMGMGMHLGMNNGMGQGTQMLPAPGLLPGPGMQGGGYNPMMGMGGYPSHQPYGGHRWALGGESYLRILVAEDKQKQKRGYVLKTACFS